MPSSIEIKDIEPRTIACLRRTGAFDAIPAALGELFAWVNAHGLEPVGPPGGRYFTDPSATPVDENEWEAFVEIAVPRTEIRSEMGSAGPQVREDDGGPFAVTLHRGPYHRVSDTYDRIDAWMSEHEYEHAGPPEELYLTESDVPPEDLMTEVRVPVIPAPRRVAQPT